MKNIKDKVSVPCFFRVTHKQMEHIQKQFQESGTHVYQLIQYCLMSEQLLYKNINSEIYTQGKELHMKDNIRDREYRFRANKEESELIEERFQATEFQDISKYLRHMATVGGVLINVDSTIINDLKRAVFTSSNNINMIARQLNVTGKIDEVDVEQLKSESAAMREELKKITHMLEAFSECEEHSRSYYLCE